MAAAIGFLIAPDDVTGALQLARKARAAEELQNAAGYVVAAYLLTCYVEHYYGYNGKGKKGEKGDVFRSAIAACADLGYESLKAWVLNYIQKYCRSLFEKIGQWCGSVYKNLMQGRVSAAALKAGEDAFGESLKGKFTTIPGSTNFSELSFRDFDYAKGMKKAVHDSAVLMKNMELNLATQQFAAWLSDKGYDAQEFVMGRTLDYFLGGGEDGTKSIGGDAREVLYEALTRWLGVKVGDVYEIGGVLNPYNVTYRVEDGKLKIGIFGYVAEISILENIIALSEWFFESLFAWMGTLWEIGRTAIESESIPDPRVFLMKSTADIAKQHEKQKQRDGRLDWQYTEYKKKTESGWETIL
jgi:hypothetical protein